MDNNNTDIVDDIINSNKNIKKVQRKKKKTNNSSTKSINIIKKKNTNNSNTKTTNIIKKKKKSINVNSMLQQNRKKLFEKNILTKEISKITDFDTTIENSVKSKLTQVDRIEKQGTLHKIYKNIRELDKRAKIIYNNSFTHLYLYDEINHESVERIIQEINNSKKINSSQTDNNKNIYSLPKPIVIHINSPGGDINAGFSLANAIYSSHIPIIVIGEGVVASAATFVLVTARLSYILENCIILIHQYFGVMEGKHEEIRYQTELGEQLMKTLVYMYKKHTKMSEDKIKGILNHDIYISSSEAIEWGLVDELVIEDVNMEYFLYERDHFAEYEEDILGIENTNTINFVFSKEEVEDVTEYNRSLNFVKYLHSLSSTFNATPLYIKFSDSTEFDYFSSIIEILPIVNAIAVSRVPMYGIVLGPIRTFSALVMLTLKKRYMYEKSYIQIDLVSHSATSRKFVDTITNTKFTMKMITSYFVKYTKFSKELIDNLFKKQYYFNANEALKYGLVDYIV